jgi:CxxC-x17-CxxC domain-containing protein
MSYQDKSIQCSDCGATFTFSADEQEQFASRGYTNEPKRCPTCRQTRKAQQNGGGRSYGYGNSSGNSSGYTSNRQMFAVKCSDCGKDTQVPFEPTNGRPVYCSDCYRKVKNTR